MSFELRQDQTTVLADVRHELRTLRSCLIVASCGWGKGVVTTKIIENALARDRHVLFLVKYRDRVNDMHERVSKLGVNHGVLMGSHRRERWHQVQVGSVDTVHRLEKRPPADLVIIDECHLGLSPTFRSVLDAYPQSKILGLTATPMLGNGRPLGAKSGGIFESMVLGPSVTTLIKDGHLVGSRVLAPPIPEGLAGLRKKKTGEFDEEQGAAICDNAKVIGDIVDHYKRYASDRKAVVFGFNQKHAFDIAESFRAAGLNWAYVDALTPDGDIHTPGTRKFFWHQYDHGDLVGISSCQTISIGWDHSIAKCLIFASKTSSLPLFHQRLGRGSRPHPGFDHFRVHDHTGNLREFEDRNASFFESEIDWQLDAPVRVREGAAATKVTTCNRPVVASPTSLFNFKGEVSQDGKHLLPCFGSFPAGPDHCPYCGIPLEVRAREVQQEEGELQEVTVVAKSVAQVAREEKMKSRYLELVKIGRTCLTREGREYKAGWPAMAFHLEFRGMWPKAAWKKEADAIYGQREVPLMSRDSMF